MPPSSSPQPPRPPHGEHGEAFEDLQLLREAWRSMVLDTAAAITDEALAPLLPSLRIVKRMRASVYPTTWIAKVNAFFQEHYPTLRDALTSLQRMKISLPTHHQDLFSPQAFRRSALTHFAHILRKIATTPEEAFSPFYSQHRLFTILSLPPAPSLSLIRLQTPSFLEATIHPQSFRRPVVLLAQRHLTRVVNETLTHASQRAFHMFEQAYGRIPLDDRAHDEAQLSRFFAHALLHELPTPSTPHTT